MKTRIFALLLAFAGYSFAASNDPCEVYASAGGNQWLACKDAQLQQKKEQRAAQRRHEEQQRIAYQNYLAQQEYLRQQQIAQAQAQNQARARSHDNSNQAYWDRINNNVGGINIAEHNARVDQQRQLKAEVEIARAQAQAQRPRVIIQQRGPTSSNCFANATGTGLICNHY